MNGLYAIVDVEALFARALDPVRFADAVLAARPWALQLRDKARGAADTLATLRILAPLARDAGVPLFGNDRPDLAVLAGCDGVHVGQDDVPPAVARRVGPLRVGLSTHAKDDLDRALDEPIDYVAIGPIFATQTKERSAPIVGVAELAERTARVRARRPGLPVVAIGGIDASNAASVAQHSDACAVVAALLPRPSARDPYGEIRDRALELATLLTKGVGA